MKLISAILISMGLLAGPGCISTQTKGVMELPDPDAIVDVYFDGQLWGSLGIIEGRETKREFDDFITVMGEPTGLGVEIIGSDFRITETSALGKLEIQRVWLDPKLQDRFREYPQFPVLSIKRMSTSRILLKFDSPFNSVIRADGTHVTGYDLDTDEGWRIVLRKQEDTERTK